MADEQPDEWVPSPEWLPSPGETVRVRQWNRYVASFAKKVAERDAVVVQCWKAAIGCSIPIARVRFLKRNGRGKEFEETFRVSELIPWPTQEVTNDN